MALIGWWPLDGNTEDYTINQNHGVNSNVTWTDGKIGQAGSFNGTTSKINITSISSPTTFSISAWIYRNEANREQHVAEFSGTQFYINSANRIGTSAWSNVSGTTVLSLSTWYHILLIRDVASIKIYLNGVKESETTTLGTNPLTSFIIGQYASGGNYWFNGLINDVRVYDNALSQKEINDLVKAKALDYNFNNFQEPTTNLSLITYEKISGNEYMAYENMVSIFDTNGIGTYTFSFDLKTEISGDINVYCVDRGLSDVKYYFSSKNFTATTDYQRFEMTVDVTLNSAAATVTNLAFYGTYGTGVKPSVKNVQIEKKDHSTPFIEGSRTGTVYDGSGYKRNSELIEANTPKWVSDSRLGSGAYQFDGISNKITVNPDPLGDIFPRDFTISLWTKGEIRPAEFTYIAHRGVTTPINLSVIYIGAQNSGFFSFGVNGAWTTGTTSIAQDPNLWYHLVLRYQGTTVTGFINGVVRTTYTTGITNTSVGSYLSFGDSTASGSNRAYNGIIDDIKIYGSALSNTDILDLYQTRIKIDDQGNLYANEFVEDYEVADGLILSGLFEDENLVNNGTFNTTDLSSFGTQNISMSIVDNKLLVENGNVSTYQRVLIPITSAYVAGDILYFRYSISNTIDGLDIANISGAYLYDNTTITNFTTRPIRGDQEYSSTVTAVYDNDGTIRLFGYSSAIENIPVSYNMDDVCFLNLTALVNNGYFTEAPTQDQIDIWYRDYKQSRTKSNGQIITKEFSEIDDPNQKMKIFKDSIQIQGSLQEG